MEKINKKDLLSEVKQLCENLDQIPIKVSEDGIAYKVKFKFVSEEDTMKNTPNSVYISDNTFYFIKSNFIVDDVT